jgi:hypothetical protein
VGGGGWGDGSFEGIVEMGSSESRAEALLGGLDSVSTSVSEPEPSSSQLSATGFDLGLWAGFCGVLVDSWRWASVDAISGPC